MLKIEKIKVNKMPSEIKYIWDELLESSYKPNFQNSSEFIEIWLKSLKENWEPIILKFIENESVIGILGMMSKKQYKNIIFPIRELRILGSPMIDFSVIICNKKDSIERISDSLFLWLRKNKIKWDMAIIDNVNDGNPWKLSIENNINKFKFLGKKSNYYNYYINLKNTWNDIYSKTNKKFVRRNISLYKNRINRDYGSGKLNYIFNPDWNANKIINNINKIKKNRELNGKTELNPIYEELIIDSSKNNMSIITFWLSLDGVFIAYGYGFLKENKFYWWQTAYDDNYSKYSPGRLLLYYTLKYFSENFKSVIEFNFMRGSNSYKSMWTNKYNLMNDYVIFNTTFYGKYIYYINLSIGYVKFALKQLASFTKN